MTTYSLLNSLRISVDRHSRARQTGHGEIDVPSSERVQRRGGLRDLEQETDGEGRLWDDEQGYSGLWSHLGLVELFDDKYFLFLSSALSRPLSSSSFFWLR